jgi:L-methionine (R)-S-oxide reductase
MSKSEKYTYCLQSIKAICENESDLTANLANASALLKECFEWWWVGFYLVVKDQLVLGPFQGQVACTRISMGKGVCGTAWSNKTSLIVNDVNLFEGHIACSAKSKSEIVVPIVVKNTIVGVLDADSEHLAYFDSEDQKGLEAIACFLATGFK